MKEQENKLNQYLTLSKEITELENKFKEEKKTLKKEFSDNYTYVKKELEDYIAKIKSTVEIVCRLHSDKVRLLNGSIDFYDKNAVVEFVNRNQLRVQMKNGLLMLKYSGLQLLGGVENWEKSTAKYLTAVIKKENVLINLTSFAMYYNTIVDVYTNIDDLQEKAFSMSMQVFINEIAVLKSKREAICGNPREIEELVKQAKEQSEAAYHQVMINDGLNFEKNYVTEVTLPFAYQVEKDNLFGVKHQIPLIRSVLQWKMHEDGIMVFRTNNQGVDHSDLLSCAINIILRFLFAYPTVNKKLLLCDSSYSNLITTFAGVLENQNRQLLFEEVNGLCVKNSDDEIRASITSLSKTVSRRIMVLGQSRCKNLLEYNQKNQDNPLPLILVVLNGYPFKYENVADDLVSVLKNGKDAGVYFLIVENTNVYEDTRYYHKQLPELDFFSKRVFDFKVVDQKGYLCEKDKLYLSNTCGKNYNLNLILSAFKTLVSEESKKIVTLNSIIKQEDFSSSKRRKEYSKSLSIPFGKQGANSISLDLRADDNAHLAVIGTTGSGKTAFMNTFILSLCKLYSPDELELHLIIMVKGDFKIFEEQGLPHLKTIVTGDDVFAANDVFGFIEEEMERRSKLIGSYGNIYAYNEATDKPLPRSVVVIDEFFQLVEKSDEVVDRIIKIAQTGRAYGISLVISSIRFPMEVNSIIPLFRNRIEFQSGENAGQLIPEVVNRQSELEGVKGLCFFSERGHLHNVKVAFAEEGDKLKEHIQNVKKQYPFHKMKIRNNIQQTVVFKEEDAPYLAKRAKRDYEDEGILKIRLGTTYLSNRNLEYALDSKNHLLFLFGHYLDTKMMEASLVKDIFVLSREIKEPTVYYIDYNKNASLRRKNTVIKKMRDHWVLSGKMVYSSDEGAEEVFEEIKALIDVREHDEESDIYPILVVLAKADEVFADDDQREILCELITRGKENSVYFVIQCNEPVDFYNSDKYVKNAIVFPDRYNEDEESYTSVGLSRALESLPAGSTEKGRKLLSNLTSSALHPKLHLLCDNSNFSIFVPYEYEEDYLKHIVD